MFHSPQEGHFPIHFGESAPQLEQTYTVLLLPFSYLLITWTLWRHKKHSIFKIIKLSIHGRKDGLLSEKIKRQLLFLSFELPEVAFPLRRNDFHLIEAGTDHRLDRVADVNHFT